MIIIINTVARIIEFHTKARRIYMMPAGIKGLYFVRQYIKNKAVPIRKEYLAEFLPIAVI